MIIKITELENLVKSALLTKYTSEEAEMISKVILFGELSGKKSHGIVRLIAGTSSVLYQKPTAEPEIIQRTKLSKVIVGHDNPAMLLGPLAMSNAIEIAKEYGFGIVGTNNSHSTSGCLSYYLEQIALNNLIGIVMSRSTLCIAPFNSIEPLFGTNPIGFAIPSKDKPLIFDMGGSAISFGAILKAKATNQQLPENVAIDFEGNPTTDPSLALDGSMLPFDRSYKSSGLAMMVEILSGVLPGAGFLDINNDDDGWGNTFFVMKPDLLIDLDEFEGKVSQFVERLRTSKTKDGQPVRITGEETLSTRDKVIETGEVEVADELIEATNEYIKSGKLI